jgi:hypothetical protein
MACKFIRKLMLMMMELFILVLLKVQANDLSYISLHPSSPPTLPPHVPKLDKVKLMILPLCHFVLFVDETCLLLGYYKCWGKHNVKDTMTAELAYCVNNCIKHRTDTKTCLVKNVMKCI